MGKEGEGSSQGTCMKDPWTRMAGGRIECWGRVGRAGESNGGKMGTTVIEQQQKIFNKKIKINDTFNKK